MPPAPPSAALDQPFTQDSLPPLEKRRKGGTARPVKKCSHQWRAGKEPVPFKVEPQSEEQSCLRGICDPGHMCRTAGTGRTTQLSVGRELQVAKKREGIHP